jgi:hypothetical protein
VPRFNQPSRCTAAAKRAADLGHAHFQDRITHARVGPDRVEELLLGDKLTGPLQKVMQQGQRFGPQWNFFGPAPQALLSAVEMKRVKEDDVSPRSRGWKSLRNNTAVSHPDLNLVSSTPSTLPTIQPATPQHALAGLIVCNARSAFPAQMQP